MKRRGSYWLTLFHSEVLQWTWCPTSRREIYTMMPYTTYSTRRCPSLIRRSAHVVCQLYLSSISFCSLWVVFWVFLERILIVSLVHLHGITHTHKTSSHWQPAFMYVSCPFWDIIRTNVVSCSINEDVYVDISELPVYCNSIITVVISMASVLGAVIIITVLEHYFSESSS